MCCRSNGLSRNFTLTLNLSWVTSILLLFNSRGHLGLAQGRKADYKNNFSALSCKSCTREICYHHLSCGLDSEGTLETILVTLYVSKDAVALFMGRSGLKGFSSAKSAWKNGKNCCSSQVNTKTVCWWTVRVV